MKAPTCSLHSANTGSNLTRTRTLCFRITQTCLDSPDLSSFTQSYSDSPSLAWIQSDSRCLTRIHRASLPLRFRSHSDSLRFPDSRSDSARSTQMFTRSFNLVSVHTRFRSVQILSDSRVLVQIHSDLLRSVRCHC